MAKTEHRGRPIISAADGSVEGELPTRAIRGIDKALAIQRPVVLAHLRSIRRRHLDASPAQLVRILERRYLAAVTTGGAAVGMSGVVPGIGTGISLALSGVETAGFLEATALFAQSVSEVHGVVVDDPERARALVLTMMLGSEGSDLVRNLAGQVSGTGKERNRYWGEIITMGLPQLVVGPLTDRLKSAFLRRFAVVGGSGLIGRALPFGVGAVVGGTGNHMLGRKVVQGSRFAFGAAPENMPASLEDPELGRIHLIKSVNNGARAIGAAAAKPLGKVGGVTRRRRKRDVH